MASSYMDISPPTRATSTLPTPPNDEGDEKDNQTTVITPIAERNPSTLEKTQTLSTLLHLRRSIRAFLPDPVPTPLLHHALDQARLSASNSNIQPWRLFISTGPAKERLRDALVAEAARRPPILDTSLPDEYKGFRSAMGAELYGPHGYDVAHGDERGRKAMSARNYEFFGAPVAGIVCVDRRLHDQDVLSVGMYLQSFMLSLTEQGLGSCMQVSIAGYEDVVREVLRLPAELKVLCGFAVGYADPDSKLNRLTRERDVVERNVVFLE